MSDIAKTVHSEADQDPNDDVSSPSDSDTQDIEWPNSFPGDHSVKTETTSKGSEDK
jgi:hypothetical protein